MAKKRAIDELTDATLNDVVHCLRLIRKELKNIREELVFDRKLVYNNAEACSMLSISEKTMKVLRDEGKIGFSKAGKSYLYSRTDILNYLKDSHTNPFKDSRLFRTLVNKQKTTKDSVQL